MTAMVTQNRLKPVAMASDASMVMCTLQYNATPRLWVAAASGGDRQGLLQCAAGCRVPQGHVATFTAERGVSVHRA